MIILQERVHAAPKPYEWQLDKLHRVFRVRRGIKNIGMQEENLLSLSFGRIVQKDIETAEGLLPENFEGYQIVEPGNIVLRLTDLQNDKRSLRQGLVTQRGIITSAYDAVEVQRDNDPRFWFYSLLALDLAKHYYSLGGGVRQSVKFADFPNDWVYRPNLATQRQIADFLDRETARIDLLIEKKRRLVALLGEKFQALRHIAIARGAPEQHETVIGPNQWFDRVPKSWTVKPLRHVVLFQRGHDLPSDARTEGKYPIYSSGGISGTHSMCSSNAPGIVTGRYGTIGKFHFVEEDYWALNTSLYSRTINEHPKYVFYLLEDLAHIFILNSAKSAVPGVDRNDLHSELVPVAPRGKQVAIAEHLDALKNDLGIIEVKTNASIDRLKEYRSALITAAVTGQIDVSTYAKSGTPYRHLDAIQEETGA